ncbi:metalloregulator ArsR/SmtB family transcription factor [Terasakiella sp. A23]|uniref:ArsR/SmtB family transcription factor n=1 Tax=Terasakiella sp. FCG-A23 TaxID=3080561 RepID=UPI002953D82D|nr:metalloregulator ArsR/SmtB family transcription factor [Terasakiella sp. A23]MDV7338063.1 metalloregulator ArsR/SmtB family transcription factor [Terasakiella sp. A23]
MKTENVVHILSALAYEARLDIYRYLVRIGPDGAAAGDIAAACDISASTLSHHLNQMRSSGLVDRERKARSLIYSVNFDAMNDLIGFLSDECCEGKPELCLDQKGNET